MLRNRAYKYNCVVPVNPLVDFSIASYKEESQCRICMEPRQPGKSLISPCRCRGSLKFVHEECLKTWLVSLDGRIDEAKCELCKTQFQMEFKIRNKCRPGESCKESTSQCLFMPLLLAVVAMLVAIAYLLGESYMENEEDRGYTLALMITCSVSALIILGIVVNGLKETCCRAVLAEWCILNQTFDEPEEDEPEPQEAPEVPRVMVIPRTIQIGGRKVETPALSPPLPSYVRRGRVAAFTPKPDSPFVTMTRQLAYMSDPTRILYPDISISLSM